MRTYKKIILIILVLAVLSGLVFWAFNSKRNVVVVNNINTTPIPQTPGTSYDPNASPFGEPIVFKVNDKFTFTDSLSVELKSISDSRCPQDVECIWQGELSGNFTASGGTLSSIGEVRLGTVLNKTVSLGDYTFILRTATKTELTVIVQKN